MWHPAIIARILEPVAADLLNTINQRKTTTMQMYHCHKIVEASRMTDVASLSDTGPDGKPYIIKHRCEATTDDGTFKLQYGDKMPQIGDYVVRYADGYVSWSPAKAFEEGYTAIPAGEAGDAMYALHALRQGKKVARRGWNGAGQFLTLQMPDEYSKMSLPYIFITTVTGDRVPWVASQTDMLSNDWYIVE